MARSVKVEEAANQFADWMKAHDKVFVVAECKAGHPPKVTGRWWTLKNALAAAQRKIVGDIETKFKNRTRPNHEAYKVCVVGNAAHHSYELSEAFAAATDWCASWIEKQTSFEWELRVCVNCLRCDCNDFKDSQFHYWTNDFEVEYKIYAEQVNFV